MPKIINTAKLVKFRKGVLVVFSVFNTEISHIGNNGTKDRNIHKSV